MPNVHLMLQCNCFRGLHVLRDVRCDGVTSFADAIFNANKIYNTYWMLVILISLTDLITIFVYFNFP